MEKIIEIPEGYEARIEGNKVILEMKESEDERIRKALIEMFNGLHSATFPLRGITREQYIAWLEKQKEQKPITEIEDALANELQKIISDWQQTGANPYDSVSALMGDVDAVLAIVKKEQKPADQSFEDWIDDWYQGSKELGGDVVMSEKEFKNWSRGIRNMFEQKPAEWSEEDKNGLTNTIALIQGYKDSSPKDEFAQENCNYCLDWLKSLRPQPKAEWSEKDEKALDAYADEVVKWEREHPDWNKDCIRATAYHFYRMIHWKPSKEQVIALRWVLNNIPYNMHKEHICHLLEQIKELYDGTNR